MSEVKLKIRNETNDGWYEIGAQGAQGTQGTQGNQGAQGSQGSTGATGPQGNAGPQGSTGPQGVTGAQGNAGSTGAQGPQGSQGQTGAQGSVGAQGVTGAQGVQGSTGATGPQGAQGQTGAQGAQGNQGSTGATGGNGVYGGNSQPYLYRTGYGTNPSNGEIKFSSDTFASVTQIKINKTTSASADASAWIDNFDLSTNTTKGTLSILKKTDANIFRVFDVTSNVTSAGSYFYFTVTPVVTAGTLNDSDEVVASYVNFGSIGATGAQGPQGAAGAQGATGPQGSQGATGNVGAQGSTGPQGNQGATGAQGATGSQGSQGATGATGAQGSTGPQGNQGQTGATGAQGFQGSTGAQGATGPTGPQGAQGAIGSQGATGPQGAQGLLGDTLASAVTIAANGYFKVGTGTKDTNLYGFQIDDKEIVAQINGQDTSYISSSGEFMTKLGKIGGWTVSGSFLFDTPTISNCKIAINSLSASIYARPVGSDDATAFVMFGQTYIGGNWTGYYGISAVDGNGATIFRLDDYAKQIAGFNFTNTQFYTSNNGVYVGMQSPSSATTKVFHAGSSDEIGTGAKFSVQTNGKTVITSGSATMFDSDAGTIDAKNLTRVFYQSQQKHSTTSTSYVTVASGAINILPGEKVVTMTCRGWLTYPSSYEGKARLVMQYSDTPESYADYQYGNEILFGDGSTSCFDIETTEITMSDNTVKLLKDVVVGDIVKSFDELTHIFTTSEVIALRRDTKNEIYNINNHIKVTDEHPLYTENGWTKVKDINVNDKIMTTNGWVVVETKELISETYEVGTLTMKRFDNPSFIANGYVAHNKGVASPWTPLGVSKTSSYITTNMSFRWAVQVKTQNAAATANISDIVIQTGGDAFTTVTVAGTPID